MASMDSQTDLRSIYRSSCDANTDLLGILSTDLPPNQRLLASDLGYFNCTKRVNPTYTNRCNQARIVYNNQSPYLHPPAFEAKPVWTVHESRIARQNVFCHEAGHGVGLMHMTGQGGCMGVTYDRYPRQLAAHHVLHINALY